MKHAAQPNRRSIRLKGYDYSKAGLYFLTINTEGRECLFGAIDHGRMILNEAGKVADQCWKDIPLHFPDAVLHEYVVMPDHVHGIIELTTRPGIPRVNKFQKMIPRSIGSIVRGFKIGVTKWFRYNDRDAIGAKNFLPLSNRQQKIWQRNYYEHIIRDHESYLRIAGYIKNNPKNWK